MNIITSAALWRLWKLRNNMSFQNIGWRILLNKIAAVTQSWSILCPENKQESLGGYPGTQKAGCSGCMAPRLNDDDAVIKFPGPSQVLLPCWARSMKLWGSSRSCSCMIETSQAGEVVTWCDVLCFVLWICSSSVETFKLLCVWSGSLYYYWVICHPLRCNENVLSFLMQIERRQCPWTLKNIKS